MIRTPQHYLAFFRKRFSFVVLAASAFLFFIISQTNNVFAENKKIVDEIESFLSIQNDAHEAMTSGINSLERSCFSDLPDVNSDPNIVQLKNSINQEREENLKTLSLIQNSIVRINTNSDALVSENCSLFDLLIEDTRNASVCGKSRRLKKTSDEVLSQILEQKQISEKMNESFDRLLRLEAKQCASSGFTLNIFNSYQELISKSVGETNSFYGTKLQSLKTPVQELQKK